MTDADELTDDELTTLVRHLIVDFTGGASPDHLHDLFARALANPRRAYMVITLTCSLAALLMRTTLAPALAAARAAGAEDFWGLHVEPASPSTTSSPEYRGKRVVMQTITAQLNEDRETAAALVMAVVKSGEGAELCPHLLVAALEVFAGIYATPEGLAAVADLGILDA